MKKGYFTVVVLFVLSFLLFPISHASSGEKLAYPKTKEFGVSATVPGLKPRHDYVVCINGYGGHSSNDVIIDMGQLWRPKGEGYCDMNTLMSNDDGTLDLRVSSTFPAGKYRLKVLLKDPENDWKVVWNLDDIRFEIAH